MGLGKPLDTVGKEGMDTTDRQMAGPGKHEGFIRASVQEEGSE
jgi:hypothetical protein